MSRLPRSLQLCSASLVLLVCSVFLILHFSAETTADASRFSPAIPVDRGPKSLFLQPEAIRVGRRLGKSFDPSSRAAAVTVGTVTTAEGEQAVTINRRRSEKGENVDLQLTGRLLKWNSQEGTKEVFGSPTAAELRLAERLIFDSPDYFVLAQLRGASYFTVARSVRPPDAPDNYSGPLWTIVRIDEQQTDAILGPQSPWRLYYINSDTGLVDRIVSRSGDETIEARIVSWSEQSGEKAPLQITWSIAGRTVMSYQATSVSHSK
jgi:hypothetical protein